MQMLDKKVTLEIEWVDLRKHQVGIICILSPAGKSGLANTCRVRLNMSPLVSDQCDKQIAEAQQPEPTPT